MLDRIRDGRTDLVFDHLAGGAAATDRDDRGVPLIRWCAHYGDVCAIRFLVANGETLAALGDNLDLNGAAFHGGWSSSCSSRAPTPTTRCPRPARPRCMQR